MFGVDANTPQHCIPNVERWLDWECLPRGFSQFSERCPTPLTLFGGCESGEFPRV
ncbi:hypothetical protein JT359_14705 [Candidatus Poribacteria bacterium]|nr:hypothetical protein [Candidatus Poribacteria bacterium]